MARKTGQYLAEDIDLEDLQAVYCSPLERTRETAELLLEALNARREWYGLEPLEAVADERLIEAGNEFRGKPIGHGEGAFWRWNNIKMMWNPLKPSWGEPYRDIADRMGRFAKEIVARHEGGQVIAVSHESPIWSYRHKLDTGHAAHNMMMRKAALASVTSITFDSERECVMSIAYADPAATILAQQGLEEDRES